MENLHTLNSADRLDLPRVVQVDKYSIMVTSVRPRLIHFFRSHGNKYGKANDTSGLHCLDWLPRLELCGRTARSVFRDYGGNRTVIDLQCAQKVIVVKSNYGDTRDCTKKNFTLRF
jgi:hypothetical protein